jgi:hypothetical protein
VATPKKAVKQYANPGKDFWEQAESLERLKEWASDASSISIKDIAKRMGIDRATLYRWMQSSPKICDAIMCGRDKADGLVENATYRACIGYEVEETEERDVVTKDGRVVTLKTTRRRYIPPDTKAAQFWLCNRQPETWKAVSTINIRPDTGESNSGVCVLPAVEMPDNEILGLEGASTRMLEVSADVD